MIFLEIIDKKVIPFNNSFIQIFHQNLDLLPHIKHLMKCYERAIIIGIGNIFSQLINLFFASKLNSMFE